MVDIAFFIPDLLYMVGGGLCNDLGRYFWKNWEDGWKD
jgi:hypothetical protein